MIYSLNEHWTMIDGSRRYHCTVPCSLYETLIRAGEIPDPYIGENEWISTGVSDRDAAFETRFDAPGGILSADKAVLRFEGIDTLAEVYLNGHLLGHTDNMHRTWAYEVRDILREADNLLRVEIHSPTRYIAEMQEKRPLWGVDSTMAGYPHLRKAHCMFGWDWGPQLPDLGIWRPVTLQGYTAGRVNRVYYTQRHENGIVRLTCQADIDAWTKDPLTTRWTVTAPDGKTYSAELENGKAEIVIEHPQLWWVRGLGGQPLYTCRVELLRDGSPVDALERRIGLRTLTISQDEDQWGHEFCFINNGAKVFAMGANYIPEDQIVPRVTEERTRRLLESCKAANYNFIRVWGGGWYPDESFYDWCDENGLIVWEDFMFACSAYLLTPEFESTVRAEIIDNILRLRNHASLGMWCGNNEVESAWEGWGIPDDPEAKADYLRLFENIIPNLLKEYDPETFYWPSSPSTYGGFRDSSSNLAGDMHYWDVWHNFKPIEAFRKFYYRFCSEYGFESLPDIRTVRFFAQEKDLELNSHAITAHQKCTQGNEKLLYYLGQMVNYPYDFERLVYCSQLVQADCIRSNVEHMRRARGRCMGSAYWQVNDSNPVISWSSIDYFGRWKALHYAARNFYAPLLISCDDTDPVHPVLYAVNDTLRDENLKVVCRLRDNTAKVLREYTADITAKALSAAPCMTLDLSRDIATREDKRTKYLEYTLCRDSQPVSAGTTAFSRPKDFDYLPAKIDCQVTETEDQFVLTLTADCYAKSVRLGLKDQDCIFSDNFFDIHGASPVRVTLAKQGELAGCSAEDIRNALTIVSY